MLLVQQPVSHFSNQYNFYSQEPQNPVLTPDKTQLKNKDNKINKINKLDLSNYGNIAEIYEYKSMEYYSTMKFEKDMYKDNQKNCAINVTANDITRYSFTTKDNKHNSIPIRNSNKVTITVSYFYNGSHFMTTRLYYDGVLYQKYAYFMSDIFNHKHFYNHKFCAYRIGTLYELSTLYNPKEVYEGCSFKFYKKLYKKYSIKKSISVDCTKNEYDLPMRNKKKRKCYINEENYDKLVYNDYADIEEYTFYLDQNKKNSKTIITTYGQCNSTIINNNYYCSHDQNNDKKNNTKKSYISSYSNTGSDKVESTITSNNELLELKIADKKINLDNMIGYKIADVYHQGEQHTCILQLEIPKDAKIATNGGSKYRCDKVIPTNIFILDRNESDESKKPSLVEIKEDYCRSAIRTSNFIYYMNQLCVEDSFDGDLENVCVPGIHYYHTRDDAINNYGSELMKKYIENI